MRQYKFQVFLMLISLVCVCLFLSGGVQVDPEEEYPDGKLIGQIVDPETGEPVDEKFIINIFDYKIDKYPANLYRWGIKTDEHGKFEVELGAYKYYIQFYPASLKSKYCLSPYPFLVEEKKRDTVIMHTGKITYFKRKAILGGILKLYLADMNDVRFNPQEKFSQKFNITSTIAGEFYIGPQGGHDDLNDGEQIVYELHEGKYRIHIQFEGLGFKDFKKDNILVEIEKITEVNINLDLTDITGIEGIVTDAVGIPVDGAYILFGVIDITLDDTVYYKAITNKNGYYKLTGMPEGKYYITYHYRSQKKKSIINEHGYFQIKKNVLEHLDFQFEKTIAEMENKLK